MIKYVCTICGFVYDEAAGMPDRGIAPGTRWEDLPEDWVCPMCGAPQALFEPAAEQSAPSAATDRPAPALPEEDLRELSALEMSQLCSNLARGCEKQYRAGEAEQFARLADYFRGKAAPAADPNFQRLLELVNRDLAEGFPAASAAAQADGDRGALRALVWSEKVSRILSSVLKRYEKEGEAMLENTGVYVCTICGFLYIGNDLPEICPVCKVPNWKFEKIEGGRR
ncbi:MAG: rubredoxin [Clostridiales bacterium]|nr:rubredoxin [Clostridiales bacterium]